MKISKIIGLKVEHITIIQVRKILKSLEETDCWLNAYIEYGTNDVFFYPKDTDKAYTFLKSEGCWCFDYEPHFKITVMFNDVNNAVLCKFQIL